jgi:hypothetical protein
VTGREVSVGSADLTSLIAALAKAPDEATEAARGVLQKGALNVKRALNQQAADSLHFKGMAGSVTYDTEIRRHSITAEIGPDKDLRDGAGALANIFFFGGANGGGGTGDLDAPLREEEPKMVKFLDEAMGKLL